MIPRDVLPGFLLLNQTQTKPFYYVQSVSFVQISVKDHNTMQEVIKVPQDML